MSKGNITIEGFASKDPETRTVTGHTVTTVTVPIQEQKKNQQGGYDDIGEAVWYDAEFWDEHGTAVASMVRKGTPVIITGSLRVTKWAKDDKSGVNTIIANSTISIPIRKPKRDSGGYSNNRTQSPAEAQGWANPATGGIAATFEDSTPF